MHVCNNLLHHGFLLARCESTVFGSVLQGSWGKVEINTFDELLELVVFESKDDGLGEL